MEENNDLEIEVVPFGARFEKKFLEAELETMGTSTTGMTDCDTSTCNHNTDDNDT